MKRQQHTDNLDVDYLVAGSQHFTTGQQVQDIPEHLRMSGNHVAPKLPGSNPKKGIESKLYPLSERKLRANAFAARVHSLKYYIGLIGAKSII